MPLYEYECTDCGRRFELIQKFSDPPQATCDACGGTAKRLLSAPAIQFKGSGWYVTDYARKPAPGEGAAEKTDGQPEGKKEGKTEAGKPDQKKSPAPTKSS